MPHGIARRLTGERLDQALHRREQWAAEQDLQVDELDGDFAASHPTAGRGRLERFFAEPERRERLHLVAAFLLSLPFVLLPSAFLAYGDPYAAVFSALPAVGINAFSYRRTRSPKRPNQRWRG